MSQVSLQELTRIAFRYPEKGSINFNILETIIQSILRKIKIDEVKVLYNIATSRSDISEDPYYQEYAISDDYLLDEEPSQVTETLWKNINIDSRAAAAEKGINRLHDYIDDLYEKIEEINQKLNLDELAEILKFSDRMKELEEKCRLLDQRIDDSNEKRVSETERLEKIIEEMKAEQEIAKSEIDVIKSDLSERVASKSQLVDLEDDLNVQIMELLKMIPAEDSLVTIAEHEDLLYRVEKLEMHDSFAKLEEEIEMLKNDMEEMKEFKTIAETFFDKIAEIEGILNTHNKKFDEVQSNLDVINEKLSQIDPDDINDSFANLEEEMERLKKDMENLMLELEECQKEVRTFSQKMVHCNQWINRLEQVKVDKADLKQLLETKADLRLIKQKLDRSEFALVIGDIKEINEELERLTCKVKINEETMDERFGKVDEELSLQMYKEDFILGTEPIRNRIKALIYELKRVKEIALAHLFPDAPGIAKCISCNRGAHMGGAKYAGDAFTKFEENEPPDSRVRMGIEKSPKADKDFEDTYGLSVSPTDLDSVPFPPTDAPRERNPHHLPVLFAKARPNIGLTHEKRRSAIDKELDAYFSKKPVRPIDTGRIKPQQHATSLTTLKLPLPENKGAVRKIPIIKNTKEEAQARQMLKPTEAFKRGTVFPPITNKK